LPEGQTLNWPGWQPRRNPPSDARWFRLALWIVVMTEWPETWRLLASYPDLAEVLVSASADPPEQQLAALPPASLPGSVKATLKEIKRIDADANLMALLRGGSDPSCRLDPDAIRDLITFTPLYSRKARLKEESGDKAADAAKDPETSAA
jgi:hypothetical protein